MSVMFFHFFIETYKIKKSVCYDALCSVKFFPFFYRSINIKRPIFIRVWAMILSCYYNGQWYWNSKTRSYPSPHVNVGYVYQGQTVAQSLRRVVDVDLIYKKKRKQKHKVYYHNSYGIFVFVRNTYFWSFLCTVCMFVYIVCIMCISLIVRWATAT